MKKIYFLFLAIILSACTSGKYSYLFDTGKQLDFGKGKWLMNMTESNSKVFDNKLYNASYKEFKAILGDSLIDMNSLRTTKLVAPKVGFELTKTELKKLKEDSGCDFLINIKGTIVSNGAGTVSFDNGNGYYSASNQSSVAVLIYDLNSATVFSSSQAVGKATAENSHFDNDNAVPSINSSAETLMVAAAKKLIRKYDKYRLD
ncbi:hypothetical protein LV716_07775 [Flagellimonas sp. HMM57]|uniref:hypothetical protein n=1 Tax=unclassified Flagellimonas TaxID=2644544 RepID=UPI0013CFFE8C|nr:MULTISPECIES: hypothetical protein [unclassified Flagellimonas]UII77656.1 hypothetical protein LV716_07775 [Flagellimonas sp. HMM57]